MSTKAIQVRRELRARILNGELRAGARLRVRELAGEFGVSPTPVREALRLLEGDGLVTITPNSSVEVASMSVREVEEVYFLRSHLESLATRTAVNELTAEQLAALEELDAQMAAAAREHDGARYAALNKEFHSTIYRASPYRLLARTIAALWDGGTKFQAVFHFAPQHMRRSCDEHRALLTMLRAGDAEGAAELMLKHKVAAGQALIDYLTVVNS